MNKHRKEVQELKKKLSQKILAFENEYKYSVLKTIERNYFLSLDSNSLPNINTLTNYLKRVNIFPQELQQQITSALKQSQTDIATVWDDYYSESSGFNSGDLEKMYAITKIDFPGLDETVRHQVLKAVKTSVKAGYGFNTIKAKLQTTGLGLYEAVNLARTGLAQYDNAYHIEIAKQAGVLYYVYDGVISDNTRSFCHNHVGRVYTLPELASMSNKQGLPVETSLGGYRCVHYLTALIDYNRVEYGERFNDNHFTS